MLKQINIGGKLRPIFFGLFAIRQITTALKTDLNSILNGFVNTDLASQITIVRIGLVEGEKKMTKAFGTSCLFEMSNVNDEDMYGWLDDRPEALDEGMSVYFEQLYGKTLDAILAELEKDEQQKQNAENLKNAVSRLMTIFSQLTSIDLPKSA